MTKRSSHSRRHARRSAPPSISSGARASQTDDGPVLPLGLGIGLDSGEAVPTEGGYRGGALNLAARLCSIAQPGEIFASEAVVHLARRVPGLHFGQPRSVKLKGIADRVRAIPVVPEVPLPPLAAVERPSRSRLRLGAAIAVTGLALIGGVLAVVLARGGEASTAIAANAAGLVDGSTGRLIAEVPVAGRPSAIAVGAGAVWVTDVVDDTALRIDPEKQLIVDRIEVGRAPEAVVVGGGSVWVANKARTAPSPRSTRTKERSSRRHGLGTGRPA